MTIDTIHIIETQAMQGKALASLLEAACAAENCCLEDVGVLAYSLQCHFIAILEALESTAIDAEQNALPLKICP